MKEIILSLISFVSLVALTNSKIFNDYASFDTCAPYKKCRYEKLQQRISFFSRGILNPCSNSIIDEEFSICKDGSFLCGYLPVTYYSGSAVINNSSGLIVANGLNLGDYTELQLELMGVPSLTLDLLRPFIGLKGEASYNLLLEKNFTLSTTDYQMLSSVLNKYSNDVLETQLNLRSSTWSTLPLHVRTAYISIYRANNFKIEDSLIDLLAEKKWDEIYNRLISQGSKYRLESSLIYSLTSAYTRTNSPSLSVYFVDITSMSQEDFDKMKKFFVKYISTKLPNDIGKEHKFSLVLFHINTYKVIDFDLNAPLLEAVEGLNYDNYKSPDTRRWTDQALENGLEMVQAAISRNNATFSEESYLNFYLFASGESSNPLQNITQKLTGMGVNVISIGLNLKTPLEDFNILANNDSSNILTSEEITIENLSCYNDRLHTYNFINHRTLNLQNYSDIQLNVNTSFYYKLNLNPTSNSVFRLKTRNSNEDERVNIFVSYTDPFPNINSYEYFHNGTNLELNKEVTIQGNTSELILNSPNYLVRSSLGNIAYITVKSLNPTKTLTVSFEVFECDPSICLPGTNEKSSNNTSSLFWLLVMIIILLSIFTLLFVLYLIRCYRKPKERKSSEERTSNYHKLVNP
jgi:hypothetical protein